MALDEAGIQLIAQGIAAYVADLNKADSSTSGFYKTLDDGGRHAGGFQQVVTGALREVGAIAVEFGLKATAAIGGFVKDSIGLAGDFDAGMNELRATAGKAVDAKGLEKFKDLFISLGKELPVSTSGVQQAAIEMIKGGIDPAIVAAGGLKQNIQFAAAAMGGDLVAAADVSSKILGGWASANATAEEKAALLTHATDQLTKAANASSVDVNELSLGIFNAQGSAKTAGATFDDLTTTLAALSPRFASSSEAGNSLKNVIARLQPTTKPAYEAMLSLGLVTEDGGNKFYDAQGKFVGFQQASQLLQDSLNGLTQQQKQAVLQTIFGNDAMNAAAGLAEMGAAGYQKMADALGTANGVAENAALKQQGFNTALENAKGSIEALQITIGSALLPILTDLLNNVIAPAINAFTDMAAAVFGSDEAFARLSPTAQAIAGFLKDLVSDVQNIIGAFQDAGAGSSEFAQSIGQLSSTLGLPGQLIEAIVLAAQDLISAFNKADSATTILGDVAKDFAIIWQNVIKVVQDVGDAYMHVAQAILPIVTKFWQQHGTEITAFLQTTYDKIISIINIALQLYDAIVPRVLNNIATFIEQHATGIQSVLSGAWTAISAIIDGALTLIEGILKTALALIQGDWSGAWDAIQTMSANFVLDIGNLIKGFLDIIAGLFNTSLAEIGKTWEYNWNSLVSIVSNINWGAVGQGVIDGIRGGLSAGWGALTSYVAGLARRLLDSAKSALGISSPSVLFATEVGEPIAMGILEGMRSAWPGVIAGIAGLGEEIVQKSQDIADDVQNAIAGAFGATASTERLKAKTLEDLQKFTGAQREQMQRDLGAAEAAAQQINDPKQAAAFFALRSKQILELAELQQKLDKTTDAEQQNILQRQIMLIGAAQRDELNQFNAAVVKSPLASIADQIYELQKKASGTVLTGSQSQTFQALSAMWDRLVASVQTPTGPYWPAYAPQPITNTTNFNMPVYTNMSQTAIQDSMAIAGAALL